MQNAAETPEQQARNFRLLLIGCIGVVYGDIGTSPLYAFKEAAHHLTGGGFNPVEIYGILSLIIWSLILIVTVKYVLFLLRADNKGEGGTLALMAMVKKNLLKVSPKYSGFVFLAGIFGAALFYGDSAITPAISVLSAVEGLKLVTPAFEKWVLPISLIILTALFATQRGGTERISKYFGPVMLVWFVTLGVLGLYWMVKNPSIFLTFNPYYAVYFLATHGVIGLTVLGSVFLAVTGAEALYTDLGHFGRKPIQRAWFYLVFPALVFNYLGQGAMVLITQGAIENPFYLMVPQSLLVPFVILATTATIIASQAVITGAYSLTQQAIQLGLLPRLEIKHTSADNHGQIYLPKINTLLFFAVVLLCLVFQNSSNLASAYGISVTGAMVVDSILAFFLLRFVWRRKLWIAVACIMPLITIELVFFGANLLKLFDGGLIPLLFAGYLILLMTVWIKGSRYILRRASRQTIPLTDLAEQIDRNTPTKVSGTAIFLTADAVNAPFTLIQNLRHNRVLHEHNIIVSVSTSFLPKVSDDHRVMFEHISSNITRVMISFGFMDTPDVPRALRHGIAHGLDIDLDNASYFLGHRTFIPDPVVGLPLWQDKIYIALAGMAVSATDFYYIPPAQVVEIGIQTKI
jgi:KUP system potassium uptake protein